MDPETRNVVDRAMPGALEALSAAGLQALGFDPVTSAVGGIAFGTALALDLAGASQRARRGQRVIELAGTEFGSESELVAAVLQDEHRIELTMRVLEAAARTTLEDKIAALGRVLAAGLQQDTVDEAVLHVAALELLQPPHVQVLAFIADHGYELQHEEPAPDSGLPGLKCKHITAALPGHAQVLDPVMTTLQTSGLIRDISAGMLDGGHANTDFAADSRRFQATPFGTVILSLLRRRGPEGTRG
jgi:hypothetical protein